MNELEVRQLFMLGARSIVVAIPVLLVLVAALASFALGRRLLWLPWVGAGIAAASVAFPVWAWRDADVGLLLLGYLLVPLLIGVALAQWRTMGVAKRGQCACGCCGKERANLTTNL